MSIVRDCMFRDLATLSPTSTLEEALRKMVNQRPGFAVILDNMNLVGLITEYDLVKWIVKGYPLDQQVVGSLSVSVPQVVQEETPCQQLLKLYNQRRFRRFPVVNEDGLLSGAIMERQIIGSLPRSNLLAHYRVSDLITTPPPVVQLPLDYLRVAQTMIRWHRGCVLVARDGELLGIVTEGDLLRQRVRPEWEPTLPVEGFMRGNPVTIAPERDLLYALDLFRQIGHRRLPVVGADGKLIGLLTQTDILKQMELAVRSRQAVLNPEDITIPAVWFEPDAAHRIIATNRQGAALLELDQEAAVGMGVNQLNPDPALWEAITVLLRHCGSVGPLRLIITSGRGSSLAASSRFTLVPTPTGGDRIFWTINGVENLTQKGSKS